MSAECLPFARVGGLAEAVSGLAAGQSARGLPVSVFLPLYQSAREHAVLEPIGEPFPVELGERVETARLWRHTPTDSGPRVFFIEHAGFFDRPEIYGEAGGGYGDNDRRFAFFTKAALIKLADVAPGRVLLHAHDWHMALAPLIVRAKAAEPQWRRVATVLTVHNAGYQGVFPFATTQALLGDAATNPVISAKLSWFGEANWLKAGLLSAGIVTTVSPTHARELTTPEGGFGLHETFRGLGTRLVGILNGIDSVSWNPATDQVIPARYDRSDLRGKAVCRRTLLESYHLDQASSDPVVAMSVRLVEQKGIDLVLAVIPRLVDRLQFVILGQGEWRYLDALQTLARATPTRVAVPGTFADGLERETLAGADVLLLPSRYEPCGLTQMRAQRYGTLPLVRRVGGLNDTVTDGVTGFQFARYDADDLEGALRRVTAAHRARPDWTASMVSAMRQDFDWSRAVPKYLSQYNRVLPRRGSPTGRRRVHLASTPA